MAIFGNIFFWAIVLLAIFLLVSILAYLNGNMPLLALLAIVVAIIIATPSLYSNIITEPSSESETLLNHVSQEGKTTTSEPSPVDTTQDKKQQKVEEVPQNEPSTFKTEADSQEDIISIHGVLNTDGNWLRTSNEEIINEDDVFYYKIDLPEPGKLDITINCFADGMTWALNDDYLKEQFFDYNIWGGNESVPKSESQSRYLEKGTYYLKVAAVSSDGKGKFWLMADYIPAGNNESEPNNVSEQAQDLTVGDEVRGLLSEQDGDDYYSINIANRTNLKILVQSYMEGVKIRFLNEDLEELEQGDNNIWYGSLEQPKVESFTKDFQPGLYYIHVKELQGKGIYSIKLSEE